MYGQSGLPRLSGDYNKGYTDAILELQEIFSYVNEDLKYHKKRLNAKLSQELINCVLSNREKLRDQKYLPQKNRGFIRYNSKGNFEYYEPR